MNVNGYIKRYKEARHCEYRVWLEVGVPYYAHYVQQTDAFDELRNLDQDVLLIEPDGPVEPVEITQEYLDIAIEDETHPYGHGYVLASLLIEQ